MADISMGKPIVTGGITQGINADARDRHGRLGSFQVPDPLPIPPPLKDNELLHSPQLRTLQSQHVYGYALKIKEKIWNILRKGTEEEIYKVRNELIKDYPNIGWIVTNPLIQIGEKK